MNILQIIIDFLTQTPVLYVDGVACEVECAWIGVIGGIASVAGGLMSASASSSSAKKLKRAAQKNYNMLMENAEMSKMTLTEQVNSYAEDMDSYRSSMIQRYGLAGGIDPGNKQLEDVRNYQFGIKEISSDEDLEAKRQESINNYIENAKAEWKRSLYEDDDRGGGVSWLRKKKNENQFERDGKNVVLTEREQAQWDKYMEDRVRAQAEKKYSKEQMDKDYTKILGDALKNYNGKQTPWDQNSMTISLLFKKITIPTGKASEPAESSAILNLRTSVSNMQKDINNAYKEGMINYWQQRKNAQNVKDTQQFQAAGYSTQAQTTIASSFMSAMQYGAKAYEQYKGIG